MKSLMHIIKLRVGTEEATWRTVLNMIHVEMLIVAISFAFVYTCGALCTWYDYNFNGISDADNTVTIMLIWYAAAIVLSLPYVRNKKAGEE